MARTMSRGKIKKPWEEKEKRRKNGKRGGEVSEGRF